ncbi:YceI family protein [Psychroserpens burtonensis]|uniref:YceI family protein n=1 Tax=Psychroserpens burtonensis TaxID=49278 RepID=UPI0004289BD1|nr:YceI family protein [Psychroserpens burtonensis]
MKIILILITSLVFTVTGFALETKANIAVDFKIRNLRMNVDGHFEKTSIATNFTSQDISQWVLYGNVAVNSIDTDNKKRDTHLNSDDYFDSTTYPETRIKATNFKKTSKNKYDVTVNLTIKKTTKSSTVPMEIINSKEGTNLKAYFEINRLDFEVGDSSFVLSDTVKINISNTLKKE